MWKQITYIAASVAAICIAPSAATADDFYKDKSIDVLIGYGAGGTYDATARLLARHMPKYIPGNPNMVAKNMPGSGSLRAINYLYTVAPKDGSTLGMVTRSYPIHPVFFPDKSKYDPSKFNPIGSTSTEVSVAVVWHTSGIKKLSDLKGRQMVVGASSMTDDTGRFAVLVQRLTGINLKIVKGYSGGSSITQAMEKGEVDGRFGWSWGSIKSRSQQWLDQDKIQILIQMGLGKASDLPNTPFIMDYADKELDKQALELLFSPQSAAWPLIAPPSMPRDRVNMLRKAFTDTMTDKAFIADAKRLRIDVEPVSGEKMEKMVTRIRSFDQSVIHRAIDLTTEKK